MPIAQGDSLVPLIRDPDDASWDKPAITYTGHNDDQAVTTEDFRLLSYSNQSQFELYRADDFYEIDNLAEDPDYADELEALRQLLRPMD